MRNASLVILLRLSLFVAIFASAVLLVEYQNAGDPAFCGVGSGCMAVRMSSYSRIEGVPLPLIGIVANVGLFVFSLFAREKGGLQTLGAAAATGAVVAVLLIVVQFVKLHTFCKWCLLVDTAEIVAAVAAGLLYLHALQTEGAEAGYAELSTQPAPVGAWIAGLAIAAGLPFLWAEFPVVPPLPEPIAALQVPGKVTIVSFTDFECPFCRKLHPVLGEITELDHDRVVLLRKMMPLPGHPGALPAARAFLCVGEARREAMAHELYAAPEEQLTREGTLILGAKVGESPKAMERCVDSPATSELLAKDAALFDGLEAKALPLTFVGPRTVMGFDATRLRTAVSLTMAGEHPSLPVWALLVVVGAIGAGLSAFTWQRAPRGRESGSRAAA